MTRTFSAELLYIIQSIAPFSMLINLVVAIPLLSVGFFLLFKKAPTKKIRIGGWCCIVLSSLSLLGTLTTFLFTSVFPRF